MLFVDNRRNCPARSAAASGMLPEGPADNISSADTRIAVCCLTTSAGVVDDRQRRLISDGRQCRAGFAAVTVVGVPLGEQHRPRISLYFAVSGKSGDGYQRDHSVLAVG